MPRNAEVIRQWSILRDLEASRRLTIDDLAARTGVTTRTIRRDLEALQAAGFPLFDETHEGKKYWTLEHRAFRRLDDTGFTLGELSALYFSAPLVECLGLDAVSARRAERVRPSRGRPHPRHAAVPRSAPAGYSGQARSGRRRDPAGDALTPKESAARSARVAQLLDATLHHRRVTMRYHSFSSNRAKDYRDRAAPARPRARDALRPRLRAGIRGAPDVRGRSHRDLSVTEERFEPVEAQEDAFAHSLGVHQGTPPQRIEIAFEPRIAPYVKERVWHASQQAQDRPDGGVILTLDVCQRLGAAQLDPRVRPARPRAVTAGAGRADPRRSRSDEGDGIWRIWNERMCGLPVEPT